MARQREEEAADTLWSSLPDARRRAYLLDGTRHIGLPPLMRHVRHLATARTLETAVKSVRNFHLFVALPHDDDWLGKAVAKLGSEVVVRGVCVCGLCGCVCGCVCPVCAYVTIDTDSG